MWLAILQFLRSDWRYVVIFVVGQATMVPVIMWFNSRNDAIIADKKMEIATIRSSYADAALAARSDADKQRADSIALVQKAYTEIVTGLLNVNAQLAPSVATLNHNFEVLHDDPTFACLYRPLPRSILDSLQNNSTAATSH